MILMNRIYLFIILLLVGCSLFYNKRFTKSNVESFNMIMNTYSNPGKDLFEQLLQLSQPSLFIDIETRLLKTPLKDSIHVFFKNYIQPNSVYYKYMISYKIINDTLPLIKEDSNRHLMFIYKGIVTLKLIAPNNKHKLYVKNSISNIDIWNIDLVKYPKLKNTDFLEIVIYENSLIYIPKGWWYSIKYNTATVQLSSISESISGYISNMIAH